MNEPLCAEVAVWGAGGFGREVAWLAQSCSIGDRAIRPVCFIEDDEELIDRQINGLPVLSFDSVKLQFPRALVAMGIGSPKTRELLENRCVDAGLSSVTLVHPRVERSQFVEIGAGTVVCAGNIITVNVTLGRQVQINLDCTIGHDVVMGDFTTLAPGVHVSGWVHLGRRVYVGTGAVFINGTEERPLIIGDDAVIGAGACVTRDVEAGVTVVGVPAKPARR